MTLNDDPRDRCTAASPKKCWNTPRLQKYGTLMHLTASVDGSFNPNPDGGGSPAAAQNRTR